MLGLLGFQCFRVSGCWGFKQGFRVLGSRVLRIRGFTTLGLRIYSWAGSRNV